MSKGALPGNPYLYPNAFLGKGDDYSKLGVGTVTSIISGIATSDGHLSISCVYDPLGEKRRYTVVFHDVRAVEWEGENQFPADLIGVFLGEKMWNRPAIFTTDNFELRLLYSDFHVEKDY
ncbi:MAG: hypothetical protein IPK82_06020 [Polyangiaceae bacterium]|nr:hypothetical protein [Polyangiaceae bacterium]